MVVTEIDSIERFPSAQKLCGYGGLCPSTSSSGGKTFQGKLLPHCNKWLRWAFLGCHRLLGLLRGLLQTQASAWQGAQHRNPGHARLMARITWQLLTHRRGYTSVVEGQCIVSLIERRMSSSASCAISGSGKRGCACIPAPIRRAKRPSIRGSTTPFPDYDPKPVMAFSAT